ncbi:late competence development ComFB family protein [Oscillibacter sp.]|uniref:late competence development ComFB family protein n=1 Tax=Oscillibacter sp. TaxID=1945593 RepID=UPI002D800C5D|nr:late competence development ComFB family protein [Oscillibacter sp.]
MASNNSSKTAHVMNLLSKNRGGASEAPAAEPKAESPAPQAEPAPQAAPEAEPAHAAPVAPNISSINADAAVSSQIKDALEAELEASPKAAPKPPVSQAAPQQDEPMPQAPPVQEAPAAPAQEAALQNPPLEEEEKPAYINVMQILVEEKADEYMKMFGICCCDKCRVDVRAYALNHLPPKYVVLSQNERIPRLTVYESRFASDVTAQLIQACKKVMLTPHHSRPEN